MKDYVQINLRVPPKQVKRLDKYADKMGLSRNQLLVNMVAISCDDLALLDKLGLLKLGAGIRDLFELARTPDDLDLFEVERGGR